LNPEAAPAEPAGDTSRGRYPSAKPALPDIAEEGRALSTLTAASERYPCSRGSGLRERPSG
jgi:hypothetical protein